MLGSLLDRVFVACTNRKGELPLQVEHYSFFKKDSNDDPDINWVCFVPEFCYHVSFIRKRIVSEGANMDIYVLPRTAVQPNPQLTCRYLNSVFKTAIRNQARLYSGKEVNVLGISMGNVLAFRFAEHFQVNKLVSVVPGSRLAECIWESIATNPIAESSGKDLQDYKRSLAGYNPIEWCSSINPRSSEIHLGTCDLMIPTERGKELAEVMQRRFETDVKYHRFSGHLDTILSFSKHFHKMI